MANASHRIPQACGRDARPPHTGRGMTQLLTLREVMQMTALSRSAVYVLMDTAQFPQPIRIGRRAVRWVEQEVLDFIASRPRGGSAMADRVATTTSRLPSRSTRSALMPMRKPMLGTYIAWTRINLVFRCTYSSLARLKRSISKGSDSGDTKQTRGRGRVPLFLTGLPTRAPALSGGSNRAHEPPPLQSTRASDISGSTPGEL